MKGYVLQHEQIHFAIAELTAVRITNELSSTIEDYTAVGNTRDEVSREMNEQLSGWAHEIIESELAVHTEFDEHTSMFYDPEGQNSWFKKVEKQLSMKAPIPDS